MACAGVSAQLAKAWLCERPYGRSSKHQRILAVCSTAGCLCSAAVPDVTATGLDSEMEQIIARAVSTHDGPQEMQLSQQDLAELMLELRKLGGTRVALAVCDIIDGCGKGYATRSTQVFDAMLSQCNPKLDEGVVQDVFDRCDSVCCRTLHAAVLHLAMLQKLIQAHSSSSKLVQSGKSGSWLHVSLGLHAGTRGCLLWLLT